MAALALGGCAVNVQPLWVGKLMDEWGDCLEKQGQARVVVSPNRSTNDLVTDSMRACALVEERVGLQLQGSGFSTITRMREEARKYAAAKIDEKRRGR